MTLYSDQRKIIYQGNGTTTTFDVPFYFINNSDIQVSVSNGQTVTDLVLNTDYTLSGAGDENGGVVTTTVAVASGSEIAILRQVDYKQEMDIPENDRFPSKNMERALDRLTMQTQQLAEQVGRSVTVDIFSNTDPSSLVSEIEALYDVKDEVITAAENIGSIVITAQNINDIKDAPNQANSARNSAISAQNSAVTAQLMAAQAGESVSAAAASASAADASAAASAGSAQTAQDYAVQVVRRNVGDIFFTSRLDTELNGAVECNGAQYNVADFTGENAVPALLAAGKLPYVSITDFDACVTANGSCRCFGWDGADAAVFKVPKLNDVYIMAGTAASVGEFIGESLPNIIGSTGFSLVVPISGTASGALKKSTVSSVGVSSGGNNYGSGVLNLDASDSSSVYQNGAKVRPDSIRYRAFVQIATGAIDEALETCTGVLADVAGLKDAGNFTAIGKSVLSGLGMPSGRYIDLTLGASGSSYTAPANGYFFASGNWDSSGSFFHVTMDTGVYGVQASTGNSGPTHFRVLCPVAKGSDMVMGYTLATITVFRFVYAEGDDNV